MHRYLSSISPKVHCTRLLHKRREKKFVGHLCAGQPEAWVQLVERWSPHLYSYITYNVGNETETRRLMHVILSEVIHTVIANRKIKSLTILIFSIAYRHILHYRWEHPLDVLLMPQSVRQTSSTMEKDVCLGVNISGGNFTHRFQKISPETQQLLLLRYVCGVTLTELALIVGQSEEMLSHTLYRAKLYLQ